MRWPGTGQGSAWSWSTPGEHSRLPASTCSTIDLPVLPAEHEAALALALREAVTNVVRHADAHTTIHADATRDEVTLEVCDDGRGTSGPDGSGLAGANVTALGGHVTRRTGPSGASDPAQS